MADGGCIAMLLRPYHAWPCTTPTHDSLEPRIAFVSLRPRRRAAPPSLHLSSPTTSATTSLADISPHSLPMVCRWCLHLSRSRRAFVHRCHHHHRCSGALSPPAPLQLSHPAIITSTPPTTTHTHITLRRLGAAPHPARCSRRHRCGRGRGHAALTPPKASDQIRGALALCARGVPFIETRRSLERAGAPERRDGATFL